MHMPQEFRDNADVMIEECGWMNAACEFPRRHYQATGLWMGLAYTSRDERVAMRRDDGRAYHLESLGYGA